MTAISLAPMGMGMQGMAPLVTPYLDQICERFSSVTYLEIGVGHGETLTAIAEYLWEATGNWRAVGVELPNGYSYNQNATRDNAWKKRLKVKFEIGFEGPVRAGRETITVYLMDAHIFLADYWKQEIQLALIDGCHGRQCATLEFLLLEPFIIRGGIVLMHDFGLDQIGEKQPHCKEGIDVRGAARELGLLDNKRPGWEFVEELVGDKHAGAGDMGVFQRT